jgi:hypothetical protein
MLDLLPPCASNAWKTKKICAIHINNNACFHSLDEAF